MKSREYCIACLICLAAAVAAQEIKLSAREVLVARIARNEAAQEQLRAEHDALMRQLAATEPTTATTRREVKAAPAKSDDAQSTKSARGWMGLKRKK